MDKAMYQKGLKIREEVLGTRAVATRSDFYGPLQEMVVQYCWGEVWGRSGLTRRERSLIIVGQLAALKSIRQFKLHVRGALNNGVTKEEIMELVMQTAIYCGVPSAIDAFRGAKEVFEGEDIPQTAKKSQAKKRNGKARPKRR
jgi:4-carboxymuconolactone decarboxylase